MFRTSSLPSLLSFTSTIADCTPSRCWALYWISSPGNWWWDTADETPVFTNQQKTWMLNKYVTVHMVSTQKNKSNGRRVIDRGPFSLGALGRTESLRNYLNWDLKMNRIWSVGVSQGEPNVRRPGAGKSLVCPRIWKQAGVAVKVSSPPAVAQWLATGAYHLSLLPTTWD